MVHTRKLRNWFAPAGEGLWHAVANGGRTPVAVCGHELRWPLYRLVTVVPPLWSLDDGRSICPVCAVEVGVSTHPNEPTTPRTTHESALQMLDGPRIVSDYEQVEWPKHDPDLPPAAPRVRAPSGSRHNGVPGIKETEEKGDHHIAQDHAARRADGRSLVERARGRSVRRRARGLDRPAGGRPGRLRRRARPVALADPAWC
ncbi:hypothetical protein GCM10010470_03540 [Saccharopolyspora taberi]|uniref:Uncharacterized protein n=1 Tax=Saccharopolyspora taberi TaxID=60895 RepID=A0ABN3V276_9PSEU